MPSPPLRPRGRRGGGFAGEETESPGTPGSTGRLLAALVRAREALTLHAGHPAGAAHAVGRSRAAGAIRTAAPAGTGDPVTDTGAVQAMAARGAGGARIRRRRRRSTSNRWWSSDRTPRRWNRRRHTRPSRASCRRRSRSNRWRSSAHRRRTRRPDTGYRPRTGPQRCRSGRFRSRESQRSALVASQVVQVAPATPHDASLGDWQAPFAQQPDGHESALHVHSPETHAVPAPHAGPAPHAHAPVSAQLSARDGSQLRQAAPPEPQVVDERGEQVEPEQQPLGQLAGLQPLQTPPVQVVPAQSWQAAPPLPQLAFVPPGEAGRARATAAGARDPIADAGAADAALAGDAGIVDSTLAHARGQTPIRGQPAGEAGSSARPAAVQRRRTTVGAGATPAGTRRRVAHAAAHRAALPGSAGRAGRAADTGAGSRALVGGDRVAGGAR